MSCLMTLTSVDNWRMNLEQIVLYKIIITAMFNHSVINLYSWSQITVTIGSETAKVFLKSITIQYTTQSTDLHSCRSCMIMQCVPVKTTHNTVSSVYNDHCLFNSPRLWGVISFSLSVTSLLPSFPLQVGPSRSFPSLRSSPLHCGHGCPQIGANGASWPPGKKDEKLKSENMQKKQFSMFMLYFESNQGRQL